MALEESIDNLKELSNNEVSVFVEPNLLNFIESHGAVQIDYHRNDFNGGGYTLTIGKNNCNTDCNSNC